MNKFRFSRTSVLPAILTVVALALTMAVIAYGRTEAGYDISWFTIDGGGGSSNSGAGGYTLDGTIGQSDAGTHTGTSGYSLTGGFWGAFSAGITIATQTPGGPTATTAPTSTRIATQTPGGPTATATATQVISGPTPFAHSAFQRVWDRTDGPVALGQVSRTFFWGPFPNTRGLLEQYNEDPLGRRLRLVQYFDKSRMEINNPNGNQNDPFFVTNGLLTVDLISGQIQVGNTDFLRYRNACIPMSGDFGDTLAPTYFAFQKVSVSANRVDTHPSPDRTGQKVIETIDRNGNTGTDPSKGNVTGVNLVHYEASVRHNIPSIFWDFLNSSGPVHDANGHLVNQQLINPWFFASGLPISEAYWTKATIRGQVTDVMIQAYERRALTYVPTNPAGFRVEMANIGQHYYGWRYLNEGYCPGEPVGTPAPPVPAP